MVSRRCRNGMMRAIVLAFVVIASGAARAATTVIPIPALGQGPVFGLAWRPDGYGFAFVDGDGFVRVCDRDGAPIAAIPPGFVVDRPEGVRWESWERPIAIVSRAVAFSADGRWLWIGEQDGSLRRVACTDWTERERVLAPMQFGVWAIAAAPEGAAVAAGRWGAAFSVHMPNVAPLYVGPLGGFLRDIAWSPAGGRIATSTDDFFAEHPRPLAVWDAASGALIWDRDVPDASADDWGPIAFAPSGDRLVAVVWRWAPELDELFMLDAATGELLDRASPPPPDNYDLPTIETLAFSRGGEWIAIGRDHDIEFIDPVTLTRIGERLQLGYSSPVFALATHPHDLPTLLVGSKGKVLLVPTP